MKRTTPYLAGAGVLTGVAGLVTSQATVWALQARNSPVDAVATGVRDFTPGPLAHALISRVGTLDKPLLRIGTLILLLLVCAWIGTQSQKRPALSDIAYFILSAVGLAAVLRLPDSSVGSTLAIVVGLVTWIVVDRLLAGPVAGLASAEADGSRRAFLIRSAGIAATTVVVGFLGYVPQQRRSKVEQERRLLTSRAPGGLRLPIKGGVPPAGTTLAVAGIAPWRTANTDFYQIATVLSPPVIPHETWTLRIHGMVDKELTFTYDDLVRRQFTEDWITLCCVSNEVGGNLIGNAYWSGVLIRELLAEAGIKAGADAVLQTSEDGWTCGTPLSALTDGRNAMLALAMNGAPLPVEHGYPVRMVVPGLYGFVSATKWLVDIEVTRFDKINAYWTQRGWSAQGPVLTQSRIDVPQAGAQAPAGALAVGGSAWAQHTGIAYVEYQLDGGAWTKATLGVAGPDNDTWVQWSGQVQVASGAHTLVVRATDKSGTTQTAVRTDVIPRGATGWDQIDFSAG